MAYREKDTKKWTAQWFETNVMGEKKKRRKRGFETKREALEFEQSKKLSNERSMDMKLSDFIEIYFSDKQNDLKDRTIKNKRYMMQQHIVPYFGNQMMSEIKASQIIQWQNEIQKKGYAVQQDIQEQKALEEKRQMEQMPTGSIHERLTWGSRKSEMENQQRKKNKTKNRGMEL